MNRLSLDTKDTIREEHSDLADGISRRAVCPSCEGGSTKETSLAVRRDGNILLFKCHRAHCRIGGRVAISGRPSGSKSEGHSRPRPSGRDRYAALGKGPLSQGVEGFLQHKYGLSHKDFRTGEMQWTTDLSPEGFGRLVLPVRDSIGELYGFVARKLDNQPGPKTMSFIENSRGSWYFNQNSKKLLIVEDQLSAIKASSRINAVALLGTDMSDALVDSIIKKGYETVYLALDKDAYRKTLTTVIRLRAKLPMKSAFIPMDLKDMEYEDMVKFIDNMESA